MTQKLKSFPPHLVIISTLFYAHWTLSFSLDLVFNVLTCSLGALISLRLLCTPLEARRAEALPR